MIYWAPVLHFYQPPTQFPAVLKRVCQESYRPLIDLLGEFTRARATVNINGALTEMLLDSGHEDVIDGLRRLAEAGRIELLGSAMYHPILPLLPECEIRRQIALNQATNHRAFGDAYRPSGFFAPELAYGSALLEPVADSGHRWILASGIACPAAWPVSIIHRIADEPRLAVVFRDDIISNRISFQSIDGFGFIDHLRSLGRTQNSMYVVTAMDAETFGHHIREWERLFLAHVYAQLDTEPAIEEHVEIEQHISLAQQHRAVLASTAEGLGTNLQVVTVSDLLEHFPFGAPVTPKASSWSTSGEDLARGVPYPLWNEPANDIHQLLWRHLRLCLNLVDAAAHVAVRAEAKRHADIARGLLDRALHSCQFWWASRRPMWDINMIERGLAEQRAVVLNAAKAIRVTRPDAATLTNAENDLMLSEGIAHRLTERLLA
ncbi:MAG TPA: hypothetical protein VI485_03005 [Vicinamibacterales bacterium]|nr:hypothetical protein [Vicinamibacterales bacterium]